VSLGSEFIENTDAGAVKGRTPPEEIKQDCELKALRRLAPRIKAAHPQLRFRAGAGQLVRVRAAVRAGAGVRLVVVVTFQEGRTPALWREFPRRCCRTARENTLTAALGRDERVQEFRWVRQLAYEDSAGRCGKLDALECTETTAEGKQYFAWLTALPVNRKTVAEIAQKGGRERWKIENEGFNRQKNSGLNLEHVYTASTRTNGRFIICCCRSPSSWCSWWSGAACCGGWRPRVGRAGGEAVRQPEEHSPAAAGQRALPALGGGLVLDAREAGEVAPRAGHVVGQRVAAFSPGRIASANRCFAGPAAAREAPGVRATPGRAARRKLPPRGRLARAVPQSWGTGARRLFHPPGRVQLPPVRSPASEGDPPWPPPTPSSAPSFPCGVTPGQSPCRGKS